MHILLVADGRSPITFRWVEGLKTLDYNVSLISTFPCAKVPGVDTFQILPVAFATPAGSQAGTIKKAPSRPTGTRKLIASFRPFILSMRHKLGPLSLQFYKRKYQEIISEVKPDLIHALRIPFEGMLVAFTPPGIPVVVSIWGNDLTLHANGSKSMTRATIRALNRADGLMADTHRDIRLSQQWGFDREHPNLVVPGSGGIDFVEMNRPLPEEDDILPDHFNSNMQLIINPRGFRPGSVRNDIFFRAIPLVLQRLPKAFFICTAMMGQPEALRWVHRLKIMKNVRLLPYLTQPQLWDLFRRSAISVSISDHDGTPNSLLEAMACGSFPIVGDIESLREWVTPGVNGLLVEPNRPQALADAIILALESPGLLKNARTLNKKLIQEHADVSLIRAQMKVFYQRFEK
jgi:glycosyltransferase involved in cell wall biosynthesis